MTTAPGNTRHHRRGRIVRRAVMALAGTALVLVLYVGSLISASFAWGAGWIPNEMFPALEAVYAPLVWYIENEYPGSDSLDRSATEAQRYGAELVNYL